MYARRILPLALLLLATSGCELVFTASPLSFLARDPATLSAPALLRYAEDALLGGDRSVMRSAYDAVAALYAVDASDPQTAYLAGRLGVEVSGLSAVVNALLRGEILIFGESALQEIEVAVTTLVPDTNLAVAAGGYLEAAAAGGVELRGSDYVLGAFGFLIGGCVAAGGIEALDNPAAWDPAAQEQAERAVTLLSSAADLYPAGDPALVFVSGFLAFFERFTSGGAAYWIGFQMRYHPLGGSAVLSSEVWYSDSSPLTPTEVTAKS